MSDSRSSENTPEPVEDMAGEYVLGTLSRDEMAVAEQRLRNEPDFALEVAAWQQRLEPLLDAVPRVDPPEGAFYDIRRAIGAASYEAVPGPELSPESLNVIRFDVAEKAMRRWRRVALLSGAVAASLAALVFFREVYEPQFRGTGSYVAVLESDARDPAFVATIDLRSGIVAVRRIGAEPGAGRSHELWALGGGRSAPQSLGLVQAGMTIPIAELGTIDQAALRATVFAISLEPEGGSSTGRPSGPVVFTGKLVPAPLPAAGPALLDRLRKGW